MRNKAKRAQKHNRNTNKEKKSRLGLKYTYKDIKQKLKVAYNIGQNKIRKSIRLEILWIVGISFVVSSLTFVCVSKAFHATTGKYSYTSYKESKEYVEEQFLNTVQRLNSLQGDLGEYISLEELYAIIEEDEAFAITDLKEYLTKSTNGKLVLNNSITIDQEEASPNEAIEETSPNEVAEQVLTNETTEVAEEKATNTAAEDIVSNESIEGVLANKETVTELYRQLARLQKTNQWDDKTATVILTNFLEQNNIDTQTIVLSAAQAEIDHLKERMRSCYSEKAEVYLVDSTGQLIYSEGYIEKLDLVKIIQSVNTNDNEESSTYKSIYPVVINGQV